MQGCSAMATSEARDTAAAINAAISSAGPRYQSHQERSWKGYWTRYWCFKSQKREKRIAPAARSEGASGPVQGWPSTQGGLALAPPSSPASFINSSAQSPASFSLSLSAVSGSMCSPGPPNTMFTIGPYAHETQLVSPPVFSTFTTEPSTAPFTPPPELAHLTTPSSPDVPFAQYIASSLEAKTVSRRDTSTIFSPLSTSTFASPCDTPACYTPPSGHFYLGSPVGRLISPSFAYSSRDFPSYEKDDRDESYMKDVACSNTYFGSSSFPCFDPFTASNLDKVPFAALILPCDTTTIMKSDTTLKTISHDNCPSEASLMHTGLNCGQDGPLLLSEADDQTLKSEGELSALHLQMGYATRSMVSELCGSYNISTDD